MKKLVGILMVVTLIALSFVVPVNVSAANVDVAPTGSYKPFGVLYSHATPYVEYFDIGTNSGGCPDRLIVQFHSVSEVNYYKIFCKLVDNRTGRVVQDWQGMKTVHDGGSWHPTVVLSFYDDWFSDVGMQGYWDDAEGSWVDMRDLRIYVTVRGFSYPNSYDYITGFYDDEDTWWRSLSEAAFCPTITKIRKSNTGTSIDYTIESNMLGSNIKYYRLYYRDKWGDWASLGDYNISNSYRDTSHGRVATVSVPYTRSYHNNCYVYPDGTCKFAVRGISSSGRWCTPFISQFYYKDKVMYR